VDLADEVDLEGGVMPENPVEGRDGRERLRDLSGEQIGDLVELGEVHGGGSIEEIEVHGGDRRALQRGTRIPDENRLQLDRCEGVSNFDQTGCGVHELTLARTGGTCQLPGSALVRRSQG